MRSNPNKKCTFKKKTAFPNKADIFFDKKAAHIALKPAKKTTDKKSKPVDNSTRLTALSTHFKFVGKPFTRNL